MIGIIIQARIGSTRLPNKIMLPFFKNKGILELLIEKLKYSSLGIPIILATTDSPKDNPIALLGKELQVEVFRGDERNVLKRFIDAGEKNKLDKIIRVCADNPFLDMVYLKNLLKTLYSFSMDYIAFINSAHIPTIKTHYGFWAEGITLDALKKVKELTNEQIYREHVTNFIYENTAIFSHKFLPIPTEIENENIRLTVDTIEDFNLAKEIFAEITHRNISGSVELLRYISGKPEWIQKMKNQIVLNNK